MRILLTGRNGQVGWELQEALAPLGELAALGRAELDLRDAGRIRETVRAVNPDVIVNAAAYTAVDKAESDRDAAFAVNAAAPGILGEEAKKSGALLVHYSTDYVFDGAGDQPFVPDRPTAPLNAYGRSKLVGERGIRAAGGNHLILRTSWVVSGHGANFVKTMLRLGRERDSLNVVADQIGGPTPAAAIAGALITAAQAMRQGASGGTHHFAGTPDTSWAEFARRIMTTAGLACRIQDIPTRDYPTPARRPLNSRLDCRSLTEAFGIARPDWQQGLAAIVKELSP